MRKKDCRKCNDYIGDRCLIYTKCYIDRPNNEIGLVPKEKPMKDKVIFESEEVFIKMMNSLGIYVNQSIIDDAKSKGYIRKSVVEEAEEMYKKSCREYHSNGSSDIVAVKNMIHDAQIYIEHLKAENERLKK